ncbi:MAG: hypothetical protein ABSF23_06525 [Terracidiphilus sp.]
MHPFQWKLLMQSQLSLFAPAIAGFAPAGFLGLLMRMPWLGPMLQAALNSSAGFQDLSNRNFLEDLRTETESAARQYPHRALRANILWGYADRVVHPTIYEEDAEQFVDMDHTGICKPNDEYVHPLQFVATSSAG